MIDTSHPQGPGATPAHLFIEDRDELCFCGHPRFHGLHVAEDDGTARCGQHGYALASDGTCLGCEPPPFLDLPAVTEVLRFDPRKAGPAPLSHLAPSVAPLHPYTDDAGFCARCGASRGRGNHA